MAELKLKIKKCGLVRKLDNEKVKGYYGKVITNEIVIPNKIPAGIDMARPVAFWYIPLSPFLLHHIHREKK